VALVRGYCGIGVYHPKTAENIGTLWRSAMLYGADFIFTVGRRYEKQASDTMKAWRHIPLWNFMDFDELREHLPYESDLVCVELAEGAFDLRTYVHPERAVYLLGAEDYGIPANILEGRQVVQVPAMLPHSANVAVAGSLVLYDRFVKGGPC
jgi:tRNA G18 (ribose-2'-O)-methylase SpoU